MSKRSEITYFGAGPAALPTEVVEKAAGALVDYQGTGLGLAEHSHRSALAMRIIDEAKADLASYLDVPEDYEILFMQGGGTGQFAATLYNLVGAWVSGKAAEVGAAGSERQVEELGERVKRELRVDYIVTGSWSLKAYDEACRLLGPEHVRLAADARTVGGAKFGKIPDESTWKLSGDAAMVYYCDNETVDGVEFPGFPEVLKGGADGSGPLVVADMSSNILSRRIAIRNFSVIFFGAQKNLGSTGITVALVKKRLLPPACRQPDAGLMRRLGLPIAPIILSYEAMAKNNSLYNTLSILDVYIAGQVVKKLLATYPDKVDGQEAVAKKKASAIYGALEEYPDTYKMVADASVRSRMNICFRIAGGGDSSEQAAQQTAGREEDFLDRAKAVGLQGLKGHRSVGGIRASNYNSIGWEGAEKLATFIRQFAQQ